MNVQIAAERTYDLLDTKKWSKVDRVDTGNTGYGHIEWMLQGILLNYIQHEKAHRWLGWVQACICIKQNIALSVFKDINKGA